MIMTKKHTHPILNQFAMSWENDPFPRIRASHIQMAMNSMDEVTRKRLYERDWTEYDAARKADATNQVTAIIVNLNTLHLLKDCLKSLYTVYPTIVVRVVDNGSNDGSKKWLHHGIEDMGFTDGWITSLPKNIGHGPAMCKAIDKVTTPYFLTMDTDTVVQKPGFIEYMIDWLASGNKCYAIGWKRLVHKLSGVPASWSKAKKGGNLIEYIHPYCGMYKTELYRKLPPFEHHGAPCVSNMREAVKRGYGLKAFPNTNQYHLGDYVKHLTGGTRRMYPVPDWNPKDKKPGKWNPKTVLNI